MSNEPILQVTGISKTFGAAQVLRDVSFSLSVGQVLGLAGHNGAGKSTLMNILSGVFPATSGTIEINGAPFHPSNYLEASTAGVFRIYQELSVIDNLTVAENLTLGVEKHLNHGGFLSPRTVNKEAESFLAEINLHDLDPKAMTGSLSMAQKQILEIVRSLYIARLRNIDTPVLLLDEPTSGLTGPQVEYLEGHIDLLRTRAAIVLTTHRGSELLEWSDDIIVLRNGEVVAEAASTDLTPASLASHMAGTENSMHHETRANGPSKSTVVTVDSLVTPSLTTPFNLTLHAGEVIGIISDTEDKSEIARCIAGADIPTSGKISILNEPLRPGSRAALEAGIRFVPADRANEGLALLQTVRENLTILSIAVQGRHELAQQPRKEKAFASNLVEKFFIKVEDIEMPAGSLSGGNQQKILVARGLSEEAKVVVLDRPTRGIDVSAKSEIYNLILEAADNGVAFILSSDEPEEIMPICDRLIGLKDGTVIHDFNIHRDGIPAVSDLASAFL